MWCYHRHSTLTNLKHVLDFYTKFNGQISHTVLKIVAMDSNVLSIYAIVLPFTVNTDIWYMTTVESLYQEQYRITVCKSMCCSVYGYDCPILIVGTKPSKVCFRNF